MENERKLKILAGVLGALVLGGGCCLCVSFGWFVDFLATAPSLEIDNAREGAAYGRAHGTDDCVTESRDRYTACGPTGMTCGVGVDSFLEACLDAVPSPDMSVCDGAPAVPGTLPDWNWGTTFCRRHGWSYDEEQGCGDVAFLLESWCAVHR